MTEFLNMVFDPHVPFLRHALIAGLLASVSFGIMGTYVVTRRISYIAGAIAHCVLGGIGAAVYAQGRYGITWMHPMGGAIISAVVAALVIGIVSLYAREREDTIIGAVWAIGMATGLIFISRTPGYVDAMGYLFGNILLITRWDLFIITILNAVILVLCYVLYHRFMAVCFDEEFARLRGLPARFYYMLLLILIALTIVLLVRVVGIVMVIALLTLPAAIAGHFARRLWHMMLLAIAVCMCVTTAGLAVSFASDLPSGPTIIVLAGLAYLVVLAVKRLATRQLPPT